jgi:hypothetical protein
LLVYDSDEEIIFTIAMKKLFKNLNPKFSGSSHNKGCGQGRLFMAEQLESRVLYSGAPVEVAVDQPAHEFKQIMVSNFEGITGFQAEAGPQLGAQLAAGGLISVQLPTGGLTEGLTEGGLMITLTSLDNLSSAEVAQLVSRQWVDSELEGAFEGGAEVAFEPVDYQIVEVDLEDVSEFHGYEILIDTEGNGNAFAEVRLGQSRCWFANCSDEGSATYGLDRLGKYFSAARSVSFGLDLIADSLEDLTTYGSFEATKMVLWS